MKPTSVLISILLCWKVYAQFKLNPYGRIGIGIDPHPSEKVLIKGNLVLTTYPIIPPPLNRYTELRLKVGNGDPGAEIGTPTKKIAFWSSEAGYNWLYGGHFFTLSDNRLKHNITPIQNGLEIIKHIQPYSYNLSDTIGGEPSIKKSYGFLASEMVQYLPDIVDTVKEKTLMNYDAIIPFLVNAIQQQQKLIDSIVNIVNLQSQSRVISTSTNNYSNNIDINLSSDKKIVLEQNTPNPFREKTVIRYYIPKQSTDAKIIFTDMEGTILKEVKISEQGAGQITVYAYDLSNGMYSYSLIIDGNLIETKKMIKIE